MHRLIGITVVAILWLWSGLALAETKFGVVTLDLRPDHGEVPTHLCVASQTKTSRTRDRIGNLLAGEANGSKGRASVRPVKPEVWGGDQSSADRLMCSPDDPRADCRPGVALPAGIRDDKLFVACTSDVLGGGDEEPRPLFVLLEHLEGSPPPIVSVRLAGGVATVGVSTDVGKVVVTARSLGGSYLPHRRSRREIEARPGNKVVRLDITPRCRLTEMSLPRTPLRSGDKKRLRVKVHGIPIDVKRCVEDLTGSDIMRVRLPKAPMGVGSVDVELTAQGDKAAAWFGGSWTGVWPKSPFPLKLNQLSFVWKRPACIYPAGQCPSATLETGTVCEATPSPDGCNYRCPGEVTPENALDLELPLDVTFEKQRPAQRWTDKLAQNGQVLTSYVPTDQIYLDANLRKWDPEFPANEIRRFEVFGEDGEVQKYSVRHVDQLVLKVPGANCEGLQFRAVGDRKYDDGVAQIKDGKVDFGREEDYAKLVSFNLVFAAGGGPAWTSDRGEEPRVFFSGLAQFVVQFRPRKRKASRVGFDLRLGGTLGRWGRLTPPADESDDTRLGWARVLVGPGVVVSATREFEVGVGIDIGTSFPLRRSTDPDLRGEAFNFIASPTVDFRFRIRRWVSLMLQFRGMVGERFVGEADPNDPDSVDSQKAGSLITLAGVVLKF